MGILKTDEPKVKAYAEKDRCLVEEIFRYEGQLEWAGSY